ncbi:MAG TPA: tetratricopeptide repeat protein, partial [Patescibacteria group bacterium]|nr:tetratricopeptide repeat protein [Patescibacteria group bacterium]
TWEKALGPTHPDLAKGLNGLAGLYFSDGRYARAEPLFQRALAIQEKTLGPKHPEVAATLERYAALLRKTNRAMEAAKLETRAQAIRARHASENPMQ